MRLLITVPGIESGAQKPQAIAHVGVDSEQCLSLVGVAMESMDG